MTGNSSSAGAPVIRMEAWGKRTAVVVEPRRVDSPSRVFGNVAEALEFAGELSREHGWSIEVQS